MRERLNPRQMVGVEMGPALAHTLFDSRVFGKKRFLWNHEPSTGHAFPWEMTSQNLFFGLTRFATTASGKP